MTIGHLHDDVTLLLRPESFRTLLSCGANGPFGTEQAKVHQANWAAKQSVFLHKFKYARTVLTKAENGERD